MPPRLQAGRHRRGRARLALEPLARVRGRAGVVRALCRSLEPLMELARCRRARMCKSESQHHEHPA
jgi:hypothetical protein